MTDRAGRLDVVSQLVPAGARLADVGTDSATLPIRLLDRGRVSFCVASDRADAGLARAARRARRHVAEGRLVLRRANGLDAIRGPDRIEVVTITGLGARSIRRILTPAGLARPEIRRLVLQPQGEVRQVRECLRRLRFGITDERLVRQRGRDYVVIAAERDPIAASRWQLGDDDEDLLEAGPRLIESSDPGVRAHWERELDRQLRILAQAHGRSRRTAIRRRDLARRILARLSTASNLI